MNRSVSWARDGIRHECEHRHADIVVSQLGMEGTKLLSSRGTPKILGCVEKEDERESKVDVRRRALEFGPDDRFRALTAIINYIAQDRADLVRKQL